MRLYTGNIDSGQNRLKVTYSSTELRCFDSTVGYGFGLGVSGLHWGSGSSTSFRHACWSSNTAIRRYGFWCLGLWISWRGVKNLGFSLGFRI